MNKIILISILLLFSGCASKKGPDLSPNASRKTIGNMPEWFINPPKKEGFRYYASTATSQDMQMALDKARTSATTTLAGLVESEWNGLVKRAQEETGLGVDSDIIDQFSNTQEQIISKRLNDISISEQTVQDEKTDKGRIYRAYVLVEFNEGAANNRLLAQIKANEKIYTAIRATELFDEMEDKVAKYRKRYDN
ncbi:MAG: hypothetical protein CMF96_00435 [Candidatus Marinimicrobia bacterium]|nr:hypothetical protein [Candidatus Neomarinimicrobiota bacterium]|tara:strand:- start:5108 stop:5689 length:582 start_codon:yes stop_codon:yes gene_type:complete